MVDMTHGFNNDKRSPWLAEVDLALTNIYESKNFAKLIGESQPVNFGVRWPPRMHAYGIRKGGRGSF